MTTRVRALALGLGLVLVVPPVARAAGTLDCPPGTQQGTAQRGGSGEAWCERPGSNPRVLDGPFVAWHANGTVAVRGEYRDGRPSGAWRSWHPAGAQSGEVTFVDGKPTGMLLGWYPNGQASFVGGFRDGTAIGAMETFDPRGRMRTSVDFGPDGVERSRRAWDEADREIDPRSAEARDAHTRAVQSTPLIHMALMAAGAFR